MPKTMPITLGQAGSELLELIRETATMRDCIIMPHMWHKEEEEERQKVMIRKDELFDQALAALLQVFLKIDGYEAHEAACNAMRGGINE